MASARFVLAAASLRDGDREQAISHLREAAEVPASDEMAHYPAAGWLKPVNALLKAGERESVAGFLEAYARVSRVQRDRLVEDARHIREGRMPAAYQLMVARDVRQ